MILQKVFFQKDMISSQVQKRAIETLNYASRGIDVDFDINESFVEIPQRILIRI